MSHQSDARKMDVQPSIAPTGMRTATVTGSAVDTKLAGASTVVFIPGTIDDGVHTPSVEHSDTEGSGYTAVDAADLSGPALAALESDTPQTVGYIGAKRYVKAKVTVTGSPGTGGEYAAVVILTKKSKQPVA